MTLRREASLIVRVWFEGDPPTEFRARILEAKGPNHVLATTATADEVIEAVRRWIDGLPRGVPEKRTQ